MRTTRLAQAVIKWDRVINWERFEAVAFGQDWMSRKTNLSPSELKA